MVSSAANDVSSGRIMINKSVSARPSGSLDVPGSALVAQVAAPGLGGIRTSSPGAANSIMPTGRFPGAPRSGSAPEYRPGEQPVFPRPGRGTAGSTDPRVSGNDAAGYAAGQTPGMADRLSDVSPLDGYLDVLQQLMVRQVNGSGVRLPVDRNQLSFMLEVSKGQRDLSASEHSNYLQLRSKVIEFFERGSGRTKAGSSTPSKATLREAHGHALNLVSQGWGITHPALASKLAWRLVRDSQGVTYQQAGLDPQQKLGNHLQFRVGSSPVDTARLFLQAGIDVLAPQLEKAGVTAGQFGPVLARWLGARIDAEMNRRDVPTTQRPSVSPLYTRITIDSLQWLLSGSPQARKVLANLIREASPDRAGSTAAVSGGRSRATASMEPGPEDLKKLTPVPQQEAREAAERVRRKLMQPGGAGGMTVAELVATEAQRSGINAADVLRQLQANDPAFNTAGSGRVPFNSSSGAGESSPLTGTPSAATPTSATASGDPLNPAPNPRGTAGASKDEPVDPKRVPPWQVSIDAAAFGFPESRLGFPSGNMPQVPAADRTGQGTTTAKPLPAPDPVKVQGLIEQAVEEAKTKDDLRACGPLLAELARGVERLGGTALDQFTAIRDAVRLIAPAGSDWAESKGYRYIMSETYGLPDLIEGFGQFTLKGQIESRLDRWEEMARTAKAEGRKEPLVIFDVDDTVFSFNRSHHIPPAEYYELVFGGGQGGVDAMYEKADSAIRGLRQNPANFAPMPAVIEIIRELERRGIKYVFVSNTDMPDATLRALKLQGLDVSTVKPVLGTRHLSDDGRPNKLPVYLSLSQQYEFVGIVDDSPGGVLSELEEHGILIDGKAAETHARDGGGWFSPHRIFEP